MNLPCAAKALARLDDKIGNGRINDVKKWWWDIEMVDDGAYRTATRPANRRDLQPGLTLRHEDQTLAAYPASLAPPPHPWPYPLDREAGIEAYKSLI